MKIIKDILLMAFGMVLCAPAFAQSGENAGKYTDLRYADKRTELTADDNSSDRLLNITLPSSAKPTAGYPVVLFLHGGAFIEGSKDEDNFVCNRLLSHGFAIVSANYYLARKYVDSLSMVQPRTDITMEGGTYPPMIEFSASKAAEDAALAIDWLEANASSYGLDFSKLAVMGGSAGSIAALYAIYHKGTGTKVKAYVDLWGSLNYPKDLGAGETPLLIIHGDKDTTVPVKHAYMLQQRAKEVGVDYDIQILSGRGHAQYEWVSYYYMKPIYTFLDKHLGTSSALDIKEVQSEDPASNDSYSLTGSKSQAGDKLYIKGGKVMAETR